MTTQYNAETLEPPASMVLAFNKYDGVPDDPLSVRLVRMLNLHPHLVRFRQMKDLKELDQPTKQMLVDDMTRALGIRPFAKCST
jgi:hypothetical protein